MSDHSHLGPSAAARWMTCTASVELCASLPPADLDSIYSREGTLAHAVMAECVRNGELRADDYVGTVLPECPGMPVSARVAGLVNTVLRDVMELPFGTSEWYVEKRVGVPLDGRLWGTADLVMLEPDGTLRIEDFKFGFRPVSAENNPQLLYYALGAWRTLFGSRQDISRVVLRVHCPVIGPVHQVYETDLFRLLDFESELANALLRVEQFPEFVPGAHCRYCPAAQLERCGALQRVVDDDAFALPAVWHQESPDEMGKRFARHETIRAYLNASQSYFEKCALAGNPPTGFRLAAGTRTREWSVSNDDVLEAIRGHIGPDGDLAPFVCTAAAARKAVGPEFDTRFAPLLEWHESPPRLVSVKSRAAEYTPPVFPSVPDDALPTTQKG